MVIEVEEFSALFDVMADHMVEQLSGSRRQCHHIPGDVQATPTAVCPHMATAFLKAMKRNASKNNY